MALELFEGSLYIWVAAGVAIPTAIALLKGKRAQRGSQLPLPPGPKGLPLLGNLLDIPQEKPWLVYTEWAKQYGDIIYLHALGQNIVVLNTLEASNELLTARATNYSDRATSPIVDMTGGPWSFVMKQCNTEWRDSRRVFHRFFNHTQVPRFQPVVGDEIKVVLNNLLSSAHLFDQILKESFALIIMQVSYGSDDRQYNKDLVHRADTFIHEFMEYLKPGRLLVGIIPSLRHVPSWFPGAGWKHALRRIAVMKETVTREPFEKTKAQMGSGLESDHGTSFATQLITELPPPDSQEYEYRHEIARNAVSVAYLAGLDTTYASILALVHCLASNPDSQRHAQEEIDRVVGSERLPTFSDLDQLPYVQAIIKEVVRWHPVAPLCMPHVSREEDEYNGYRIPAGTIILPNIWKITHSHGYFDEPLSFKPERYLKNGKLDPEVLDPEAAVFGFGRRICPGRHFSNQALTMLVASILACFNIKPPLNDQGEEIPMEPMDMSSLLISSPEPFKCSFVPRSQQHAKLIRES